MKIDPRTMGAVLIVAILLILRGGLALVQKPTQGGAKEVTFEEFVLNKPKEGHFRIKNGYYHLADCIYSTTNGYSIKEVYLPIFEEGVDFEAQDGGQIHCFWMTDRKDVIDLVREMRRVTLRNRSKAADWVQENKSRLEHNGPIEGVVVSRAAAGEAMGNLTSLRRGELSDTFVILRDSNGTKSNGGIILIVAGLGLGAFCLYSLRHQFV